MALTAPSLIMRLWRLIHNFVGSTFRHELCEAVKKVCSRVDNWVFGISGCLYDWTHSIYGSITFIGISHCMLPFRHLHKLILNSMTKRSKVERNEFWGLDIFCSLCISHVWFASSRLWSYGHELVSSSWLVYFKASFMSILSVETWWCWVCCCCNGKALR